ncbi:helix-turn-helix transcriptional regulator [Pseudoxanthomonas sp. PXM04]|uniref:helix-turn-helix transcriptional regulator n=1 Tax=Pseudoxanthomonas sp. PXM04 TaxID=2769297 RepID=UPI0019AF5656|nr:helix-turn-helix transcriptional regulator [Pseudoxanthomonas sp. PXM04]MBD9378869.1 helix-turn-helix transcriptional regulator [Pseudoxanthomonas sp. PXM04]
MLEAPLRSLLADVAGSRDLPTFWRHVQALVQAVVAHDTTVAWSGLSATVLGEDGEARRARARGFLRSYYSGPEGTQIVPEAFLVHASAAMLGAGLLPALDGPHPSAGTDSPIPLDLRDAIEPSRSLLELSGWRHALVLPLGWEQWQVSAGVALYRAPVGGAFKPEEAERLAGWVPLLKQVHARLLEHEGQCGTQADIQGFLSGLPVGLALFDWTLRPLYVNEEGYRLTQLWNHAPAIPPPGDARIEFHLPKVLREAGERLRQRWLGNVLGLAREKGELSERVIHPLRRDMQATLSIAVSRNDVGGRLPTVLLRYSGMAARVVSAFEPSPSQLSILSQLTPGERNVALLVMRGMSNQEIADALHRDITTVKDHLSHIYDKLGIRSRTQLAAQLAG